VQLTGKQHNWLRQMSGLAITEDERLSDAEIVRLGMSLVMERYGTLPELRAALRATK
jgi:hypothetical protein